MSASVTGPPPLEYESPVMPPVARLTFTEYPDGGRVVRDAPTRKAMLLEALVPPVFIAALAAGLALGGWRVLVMWETPGRRVPATVGSGAWVIGVLLLVYAVFDAWQNAGVVTAIEVRGPWMTWTKQHLWGFTSGRWRTADVERVYAREFVGTMLRVGHRWRLPLGAFANFSMVELQPAAALLTLAVERAKGAAGDPAAPGGTRV